MEQEEFGQIFDYQVFEAICNGEVITEYSDDRPYPSYLVYGKTDNKRPIHVLCAYNFDDDQVVVVTVYEPDPNLWIDFKKRKKI